MNRKKKLSNTMSTLPTVFVVSTLVLLFISCPVECQRRKNRGPSSVIVINNQGSSNQGGIGHCGHSSHGGGSGKGGSGGATTIVKTGEKGNTIIIKGGGGGNKKKEVHTEHVPVPEYIPVPVLHHEQPHHGHYDDHTGAASESQRRKSIDFPVFVPESLMPQNIVQAVHAVHNFLGNNPISQAMSSAANTAASILNPVVTPASSIANASTGVTSPKPEGRQAAQPMPVPLAYQALFLQNLQQQQLQQQIHQQQQQQQQQQGQTHQSQVTQDPMTAAGSMVVGTGFLLPSNGQEVQQPQMNIPVQPILIQQPQVQETVLAPIYTPDTDSLRGQGSLKEVLELAAATSHADEMWSQLAADGSILQKKKKKK